VRSDLLADIEHGRFVAFAFADDDGALHGNGVHGGAHGFGGNFVSTLAVAKAHGFGGSDCRVLDNSK
jgi:hypothetical protein